MVKQLVIPVFVIVASIASIRCRLKHRDLAPTDADIQTAQTILAQSCQSVSANETIPLTTFPSFSLTPLIQSPIDVPFLPSDGLEKIKTLQHNQYCVWVEQDGQTAFQHFYEQHPEYEREILVDTHTVDVFLLRKQEPIRSFSFRTQFSQAAVRRVPTKMYHVKRQPLVPITCPYKKNKFDCRGKGFSKLPKKQRRKENWKQVQLGRKHVTTNGWPVIEMSSDHEYDTEITFPIPNSKDLQELKKLVIQYGFVRGQYTFPQSPTRISVFIDDQLAKTIEEEPTFDFKEIQIPWIATSKTLRLIISSADKKPQHFAFDAFLVGPSS